MPQFSMIRALLLSGVAAAFMACQTSEPPSTLVGGYTLARDLDDERRVLHVDPSVENASECMWSDLPIEGSVQWNEVDLDPEIHRALLDAILDESRARQYGADTAASAAAETFLCKTQLDGKEFCYVPQLVVTGVNPPWRLALKSDIELSSESEELIETFLLAHDACWNGGTAMKDDSDD